jgi:hydroxymethylglutaryl-CoA reductase (NADPH)
MGHSINFLTGSQPPVKPEAIVGNIESQIGYTSMPVGAIGPLRINGAYAQGDFYVPMATTEGALIASYNRGANIISLSGGVTTACIADSIFRAPVFVFNNLSEVSQFMGWLLPNVENFHEIVSAHTRFGKLIDVKTTINDSTVWLTFEYTTGDAAGQNMVTICTDAICRYIVEKSPVKPRIWFLDGNMSGDKKATVLAFQSNRGKKVLAEVVVPRRIVQRFLHTEPERMQEFYKVTNRGALQSGGIGVQGHFANALAAVYIACGQDAACVSESAVGMTNLEVREDGSMYVSASLPNLTVGTVGGGTHLPTARECLQMLDCAGAGNAKKFAEIVAATVLSGEISIVGAFSAGHFARAHATHRHKL